MVRRRCGAGGHRPHRARRRALDFSRASYRIIFIHVPAAWMSMFIYLVMAGWSALALGFGTRLSAMMAQSLAPTGALMTFIALATGSLWGRPTWGTYWAWDARMTSELILLFLYLGFIALRNAITIRGAPTAPAPCRSSARSTCRSSISSVVEHAAPGPRSLTAAQDAAMMLAGMLIWPSPRFYARRLARARAGDHARARARRLVGCRAAGGECVMMDFLAMGGYGFYVWGSYGVTALVIVAEILAVKARRRRARNEARLAAPDALSAATGGTL
jgi:heme exporter protein CcmD